RLAAGDLNHRRGGIRREDGFAAAGEPEGVLARATPELENTLRTGEHHLEARPYEVAKRPPYEGLCEPLIVGRCHLVECAHLQAGMPLSGYRVRPSRTVLSCEE